MMARQMVRRIVGSMLLSSFAVTFQPVISAQPLENSTHREALKYRRVLIPKSAIGELTHGYMPLKHQDFERYVEQIRLQSQASDAPQARIERTEYFARFDGTELKEGRASLHIVHASKTNSVLTLQPFGLAIGPAEWKYGEDSSPATIGIDRTGNLVALVERSATLTFPWTLRGKSNQWHEVTFDLAIPHSPANRLVIDLPAGLVVAVDRGLVVQEPQIATAGVNVTESSNKRSRYVVQLGGATRCRLTIAPHDAARKRQQLVSVQQKSAYRLADDGFDLQCIFHYGIHHEPLRELAFDLDPELQVVSVQVGSKDVPWSVTHGTVEGERQLQVHLQEPLEGWAKEVRLSVVGPVHTGTKWRLPSLSVRNCSWSQGAFTLLTLDSLVVEQLVPIDAVEIDVSSPHNEPGVIREFQLFSSGGSLEITLARRRAEIVASTGVTIDLEPGTLTALSIIDFRCKSGRRFVLEADVPNAWTIDGIEAEPADAMEDFQFAGYRAGQKRLQIRLSRPLTSDRAIRLTVRSHRVPAMALQAQHFRPMRLLDVVTESRNVAITHDSRFRLDFQGDAGLTRLDPEQLSEPVRARLHLRAGGMVFVDNEYADSLIITITRENPTFSTAIHVDAQIDREMLTESYRILCTPESSPVQRLLIHLSESRPSDIEWQVAGNTTRFLSVRRLSQQQQLRARLGKSGETWELLFRHPKSDAFEIFGKRRELMASSNPIALAALPAANAQEGWVTIRTPRGEVLSIDTRQVKTIPTKPVPADEYPTYRACFRYDPSRNAQVVVKHGDDSSDSSPLWAWQSVMTSQFAPSGDAVHRVLYSFENWGASEFQLQLPAGCSLQTIEINDQMAEVYPLDSVGADVYSIPLPDSKRFPTAQVTFTDTGDALRIFQRISGRFPELTIPVLAQRWIVYMPPGYEPGSNNPLIWPSSTRRFDWRQRLFGPLAAPVGQRPFRLFWADDWRSLFGKAPRAGSVSADATGFLHDLGTQIQELSHGDDGRPSTWRTLLSQYTSRTDERPSNASTRSIWVESQLLANEGFSLDDPLPTPSGRTPVALANSIFARANLIVIADHTQLLITSLQDLSRRLDSIHEMADRVIATVQPGSQLSQEMQEYGQHHFTGVVPIKAWVTATPTLKSPWSEYRSAICSGLTSQPCRACEVQVGMDGQYQLLIQRSVVLWAASWATLLMTAGLVSWWSHRRPARLALVSIGSAMMALIVPGFAVPIASGVFLGTLLGGVAVLVWNLAPGQHAEGQTSLPGGTPGDTTTTLATAARSLILIVGLLALDAETVNADEIPFLAGSENANRVHSVLVPVDDNLKPTGEYDYLPLDFYDAILQRVKDGTNQGREWLVRTANYRSVFDWRQSRSELDLTSMTAVFQLETFQPLQQISFPWPNDEQRVEILEARLAGQPVEIAWNVDKTAFGLTLQSTGVTPLELVLRPATKWDAANQQIDFQIPSIPQATLQIALPTDAGNIEVPSAVGGTSLDVDTRSLNAKLGPSNRLTIRWPVGNGNSERSGRTEIEQLLWLKVRQHDQLNPVLLDAKFHFRSTGRDLGELQILADPSLRLMPLDQEQAARFHQPKVEAGKNGKNQKISMQFREAPESDFYLTLRFSLIDAVGVGNLQLPLIDIPTGRLVRRWLALTVAPDLEFVPGSRDSLDSIGTAEFLSAWGESESVPNSTYRLSGPTPAWSIAIRMREPHTKAEQGLDVTVSRHGIDWVLKAQLETTGGQVFQHRLTVPVNSQIKSVAVTSEDAGIVAYANQSDSGVVTLFLNRGVRGEYHLELRGKQSIDRDTMSIPMPRVSLLDVTVLSDQLKLYRQSSVLVEVEARSGSILTNRAETGRFRESFGRLVASFEAARDGVRDDFNATLTIRPNRPSIDAKLVTTLQRIDNDWKAIAELDIELTPGSQGLLDEFRLRISPEWSTPLSVQPETDYQVRPIPGQRDRVLVLRPLQARSDRFSVRISGRLAMGQNERVRTPTIVPLDATNVEQYLILPTRLDQQRIDWATSGLQPVPLQTVIESTTVDPQFQTAFRVWSKPRATIASVRRMAGNRQIGLADIKVTIQANRQVYGTATFQLEPAGASSCTLNIPTACELLLVTVEGTPSAPVPMADSRWRLRLGPDQVPQEVAVTFRTRSSRSANNPTELLAVPWITDFDVAQTLWSIRRPSATSFRGPKLDQGQVSQLAQDVLRLQSATKLIESASAVVIDNPPDEIIDWYLPWATRFAALAARIQRNRWQASASKAGFDPDLVAKLLSQQVAIAQELGATAVLEQIKLGSSEFPPVLDPWRAQDRTTLGTDRYAFSGPMSSISFSPHPPHGPAASWVRWIVAALLATTLGFIAYAVRHNVRIALFDEWPYMAAVCAGLGWWLWCTPSLLGWGIILISIWAAMRPPAPCRRVAKTTGDHTS